MKIAAAVPINPAIGIRTYFSLNSFLRFDIFIFLLVVLCYKTAHAIKIIVPTIPQTTSRAHIAEIMNDAKLFFMEFPPFFYFIPFIIGIRHISRTMPIIPMMIPGIIRLLQTIVMHIPTPKTRVENIP